MSGVSAEIKKVKKVLENDKLRIPPYQRPYRWSEKNVLLLLEDIFASWQQLKSAYRIGSVILNHSKDDYVYIVDGQQRITTIILILLQLDAEGSKSLASRLSFNHKDSEINIRRNHEFIGSWIDENIRQEKEEFLKYITRFCEFVEIMVEDLSEAFQMFDSQNTRGKSLESYNLLKAFHIRAMVDESESLKIECDRRWENATRFAKESLDAAPPKDILKQIFNEQLYRSRVWSRKEAAYHFDKNQIEEFKGMTVLKGNTVEHPYQNEAVLQASALNYFNLLNANINGVKSRFKNKNLSSISSFTAINQSIVNGKSFFEYIETYVEIYKQLFIYDMEEGLADFKEFYNRKCKYPNYTRTGDQYLIELYKSLVMFVFDKFGEEGLNKYYRLLYAIVFRLRVEKYQVRYKAVAKYPSENKLFSILSESKTFFDLRKLRDLAYAPIKAQRDEEVIIKELLEQNIEIESINSELNLEKYKRI